MPHLNTRLSLFHRSLHTPLKSQSQALAMASGVIPIVTELKGTPNEIPDLMTIPLDFRDMILIECNVGEGGLT